MMLTKRKIMVSVMIMKTSTLKIVVQTGVII